ncbi:MULTISPECIES: sugar kinase [unclassified Mesorhizobium]|uniref:carbohydrate kinase family protein n=1 Tax=unclassified Mesorhizobium TaxID=325217 RepID=UPI000FCBC86A|nr:MULTISPECIES: sugar kinase [unclassified Mesorhizobium]RUW77329.1 sugar kinase [Mesorhizobium sp. M4B.F.Ca.ET.049.02.1.2]TGV26822.1 sugar kinase [Mesorhizobium sp. M4B.F.Ca.ET.143.01.1.1]
MLYDYASIGFFTFDCLGRPVRRIPGPTEFDFLEEITIAVSGAAGAAAIVAAKYGMKVLGVGGVGADDMGDWVLGRLNRYGVDTSMMQRIDGVGTSSSIVAVQDNGQRPAMHMKGATGFFEVTPDQFERVLDASFVHVGGAGLMDRMDGEPTLDLLARAKKRGCVTTLDVASARHEDMPMIARLLPHVDYFLPSVEEARLLSGLTDTQDVARFMLDRGVGCCILTLGEHGAYYHHADGTRFHIPAFEVDVICTCGCGDAFNAGFAAGLHRRLDAESAVTLAQATSALNATGLGSQAGVVSFEHTMDFARRTRKKTNTLAA